MHNSVPNNENSIEGCTMHKHEISIPRWSAKIRHVQKTNIKETLNIVRVIDTTTDLKLMKFGNHKLIRFIIPQQ